MPNEKESSSSSSSSSSDKQKDKPDTDRPKSDKQNLQDLREKHKGGGGIRGDKGGKPSLS